MVDEYTTKSHRILIVEDDDALRELLMDILENEGYVTNCAPNGSAALEHLQENPADLVISDIQMPVMDGWEFIGILNEKYPQTQKMLITGQNIDEYMGLIHQYNIGNIITKGIPFNTSEVTLMAKQILSKEYFGLHNHMGSECYIEKILISSPEEIDELSNALALVYGSDQNARKLRTVLVELLTNALFYGAMNEKGDDKDNWNRRVKLEKMDAIEIHHGRDDSKIGFSIRDHGGKLTKKTILYWLNRQLSKNENGLPLGLFDTHGRGLFITRKYVDRLIVNVEKGKACECVILNYYKTPPGEFKSLSINEI